MSWLINQVSIEERTCKVDMLTFQVFPPWNLNGLFHTTSQDVYSFKSVLEVDLLGAEDELRSCKRVRGNLEKRKLAWRTGGRKLGETCCFLRFKNTSPSIFAWQPWPVRRMYPGSSVVSCYMGFLFDFPGAALVVLSHFNHDWHLNPHCDSFPRLMTEVPRLCSICD